MTGPRLAIRPFLSAPAKRLQAREAAAYDAVKRPSPTRRRVESWNRGGLRPRLPLREELARDGLEPSEEGELRREDIGGSRMSR